MSNSPKIEYMLDRILLNRFMGTKKPGAARACVKYYFVHFFSLFCIGQSQ